MSSYSPLFQLKSVLWSRSRKYLIHLLLLSSNTPLLSHRFLRNYQPNITEQFVYRPWTASSDNITQSVLNIGQKRPNFVVSRNSFSLKFAGSYKSVILSQFEVIQDHSSQNWPLKIQICAIQELFLDTSGTSQESKYLFGSQNMFAKIVVASLQRWKYCKMYW